MIQLTNIKFDYSDGRPVFKNLDFSFSRGEKVLLTGPNGSGKSTFFHLIMGLLKPQAGEICIFGEERVTEKDFQEVRRKIGFLFQNADDQLFCPTVYEDIAFGPRNLGKNEKEVQSIVQSTFRQLGLTGYEDRISFKLSEGEKRLVSLATVAAMQPDIYLFDEPTSGLDEKTIHRFMDFLKTIPSFILISHDIQHLKSFTFDRILKMDQGEISSQK